MRTAVMIDGGHLRVLVRQNAGRPYDNDYVEEIAHKCLIDGEALFRIFYYDCAPYVGQQRLPISGVMKEFSRDGAWISDLAQRDHFAVRLGVLKFRGFKPKKIPIGADALTDDDFKATFEQKGVDMRIGLDIANFCETLAVSRIVFVTNDTDCVPAFKYARRAGLQIVMMEFPGARCARELLEHSDIHRKLADWP